MANEDVVKEAQDQMVLLFLVVGLFAALFYFVPIVYQAPWFCFKWLEAHIFYWLSDFLPEKMAMAAQKTVTALDHATLGEMKYKDMRRIDMLTMKYTGWLIPSIMIIFGLYLLLQKRENLNKRYNLEEFIEDLTQYAPWSFNRHLISHNPLKESGGDVLKTNAGVRKKVHTYCLDEEILLKTDGGYKLDRNKLLEECTKQIGSEFTTVENMKIYEKALFAMFSIIIMKKRYIWYSLFGTVFKDKKPFLAESAIDKDENPKHEALIISTWMSYMYNKEFNRKKLDKMLTKLCNVLLKEPEIQDIVNGHNYVSVLLVSLFYKAKASLGVFQWGYFTWICIEDRVLAVATNDVGAPEKSIEAYYVDLHYKLETFERRSIKEIDPSRMAKFLEAELERRNYKIVA